MVDIPRPNVGPEKSSASVGLFDVGCPSSHVAAPLSSSSSETYVHGLRCGSAGSAVARRDARRGKRPRWWFADQSGADLVEYMLLGSFIAIVGVLGIQYLQTEMGNSYNSWDSTTQQIWEPNEPTAP